MQFLKETDLDYYHKDSKAYKDLVEIVGKANDVNVVVDKIRTILQDKLYDYEEKVREALESVKSNLNTS